MFPLAPALLGALGPEIVPLPLDIVRPLGADLFEFFLPKELKNFSAPDRPPAEVG